MFFTLVYFEHLSDCPGSNQNEILGNILLNEQVLLGGGGWLRHIPKNFFQNSNTQPPIADTMGQK